MMRWCRAFPGKPEHARRAREFVRVLLADTPVADDAVQAAAELVINTIQHSASGCPGGLLVTEVYRWKGGVTVIVIDQGDRPGAPPATIEARNDPLSEGGHGLRIVSQLSDSWKWRGGPTGRAFIATFTWSSQTVPSQRHLPALPKL
jgi:anti-sigma regulatory factor (Ser/Thr protein kinase)